MFARSDVNLAFATCSKAASAAPAIDCALPASSLTRVRRAYLGRSVRRTTSDVFDLQDLFTASIVAAIEPKMQLAEIERLKHKPTANLDAFDLFLRAQQLSDEFTGESLTAALGYLEQALAIDPTYAAAMALSAYCRAQLVAQGWTQDLEAQAKAGLRLASRAIELGKDDGNVFWMAAYAVLHLQLDVPRAKELAYRSLELNPNSAIALGMAGRTELHSGNPAKRWSCFSARNG